MTKRFLTYLWVPLLLAWELILQPIWNLNVETIATSNGLNELGDATQKIDPTGALQFFLGMGFVFHRGLSVGRGDNSRRHLLHG